MFNVFKGVECDCCNRKFKKSKGVNFAGRWYCSENCMAKSFKDMSTDELLRLNGIDMIVNHSK